MRTEDEFRTGGGVAEDARDHVGDLRVDDLFAFSIFPLFNDVTGGVFHFEDVGELFINTTASERRVGVGVFGGRSATTGAESHGETSGVGIDAIGFFAEALSDGEAVLDAINIERFHSRNIEGVRESFADGDVAVEFAGVVAEHAGAGVASAVDAVDIFVSKNCAWAEVLAFALDKERGVVKNGLD